MALGCWTSFRGGLFKNRALRAEGQRQIGVENVWLAEGDILGGDAAVMCLPRWFLRRFLLECSVVSHEAGE